MCFKDLLTVHGKLCKTFRYSSVDSIFLYSHATFLINTEFYLKTSSLFLKGEL